ncbi:hypothetical protein HN873_011153 [Arachis hypogaea]
MKLLALCFIALLSLLEFFHRSPLTWNARSSGPLPHAPVSGAELCSMHAVLVANLLKIAAIRKV